MCVYSMKCFEQRTKTHITFVALAPGLWNSPKYTLCQTIPRVKVGQPVLTCLYSGLADVILGLGYKTGQPKIYFYSPLCFSLFIICCFSAIIYILWARPVTHQVRPKHPMAQAQIKYTSKLQAFQCHLLTGGSCGIPRPMWRYNPSHLVLGLTPGLLPAGRASVLDAQTSCKGEAAVSPG